MKKGKKVGEGRSINREKESRRLKEKGNEIETNVEKNGGKRKLFKAEEDKWIGK